jgi:hypothetical protein
VKRLTQSRTIASLVTPQAWCSTVGAVEGSKAEWEAEVGKLRAAYKVQSHAKDVDAILGYLVSIEDENCAEPGPIRSARQP